MKNKLFVAFFLLFVGVVSVSAKIRNTDSYIEQRGMIRRDATKTLFIPKGQWMLGAQVGWQQWDTDNLHYLMLKDINLQGHTFSVGPTLGYFFAKNMAVGARFSYKRNFFVRIGQLWLFTAQL